MSSSLIPSDQRHTQQMNKRIKKDFGGLTKRFKSVLCLENAEFVTWHCGCSVLSDPDCIGFIGYCITY